MTELRFMRCERCGREIRLLPFKAKPFCIPCIWIMERCPKSAEDLEALWARTPAPVEKGPRP